MAEGKLLYKSEMASWYGTDIFLEALAMGGVMNIDSPRTISGAGSVADMDLVGSVFPSAGLSGKVTKPGT